MATVEDILMIKGPDVIVAAPTNTAAEAAKMMAKANVGSVIIRIGNEVKGIFTERDLLVRVIAAGKDPASTPIEEVMSSPIKSCRLSDDVENCANELTESHIRHLAVIEEGALIGLIGLRDVLMAELNSKDEKLRALETCAAH